MRDSLRQFWRRIGQAARLACGLPDYDTYRAHLREHHPDRVPMDREQFFRDRLQARYRRGASRCC